MKITSNAFHEVRLYLGSRRGYKGAPFDSRELVSFIHDIQREAGDEAASVRVTPTTFAHADHTAIYEEAGWEIALIQYPRRQKPVAVLNRFALNLAESLLMHFGQNRVSVVFPDEIVMLEAEDAEQ